MTPNRSALRRDPDVIAPEFSLFFVPVPDPVPDPDPDPDHLF
jgi:hypothetical protein